MDTAPLKAFATSARTELIREVSARITAVLAQGAPERVEQPKAVTALERAIAGAGGGDKGRAHVADKVAYTWFNRVVALRFMDANGYTGIGVVSPAVDQIGQPEVLAAAKRGQLDTDVVKGANPATIAGLLNGTRQPRTGVNAQAEAYALLLADYCRFWNAAMPFMFEREGDYTVLLIPANLLADDSVLSRSVTVLTEDVCQDVEVIGWLYQFYISERKDEVFAGFKKNKKAGADEIPAATQLFTPHWIVRYLVENSLGRLWMLNRPSSGLASRMDYYIAPVDEETDFLKISKPEELKVIDPACGSGHMLTYAFDLLYAIYEEDGYAPSEIPALILANNLHGTEIDPRAGALAAFALTMKARAKQRTFFNRQVEPNVCVIRPISFTPDELDFLLTRDGDKPAEVDFWNQFQHAEIFGSLIQPDPELTVRLARHWETLDHTGDLLAASTIDRAALVVGQARVLGRRYSAVFTNPPYMGSSNMDPGLADWVRSRYVTGKQDLYGAFVLRSLSLTDDGGLVALITGDTWIAIKSFERFRMDFLKQGTLRSLLHLRDTAYHADTFGANTAFVAAATPTHADQCVFIRLEPLDGDAKRLRLLEGIGDPSRPWVHRTRTIELAQIPGWPLAYWLSNRVIAAFTVGQPLSTVARPRQGLATGDNERFIRRWAEVSLSRIGFDLGGRAEAIESGRRWFPCLKGGAFRKWYGNNDLVVNWESDGKEIRNFRDESGRLRSRPQNVDWYFQPGATWSAITSGSFSMRYVPSGFISETKGAVCYATGDTARWVLALGNSPVMEAFLAALSPTIDFHEGPVGRVPTVGMPDDKTLALVNRAIALAKDDWDLQETSWGFQVNPLVNEADGNSLSAILSQVFSARAAAATELGTIEERINEAVIASYGLEDELSPIVPLNRVTLSSNLEWLYAGLSREDREIRFREDVVRDFASYAVGCMFGRYSLDQAGLILADQSADLQDYLALVPAPSFTPDADNVIPIVDGDWFEDDVVGLFRQFLRTSFGEQHFEENLKFVTKSLGVKSLRDYFITRAGRSKFYDDHVQRYKKRPIYWLFSSPKGSFNALIYMHRYTPSTVSTVLTYLREYVTKLESALQQAERAGNAKEADRLRKILVELNEYEHDTLYPKASENVVIDLDDGVKANYPKFGTALKKIAGLEAPGD